MVLNTFFAFRGIICRGWWVVGGAAAAVVVAMAGRILDKVHALFNFTAASYALHINLVYGTNCWGVV